MMLPPEIVDHILSFLDPLTLKKCIACCPELSDILERHLYANITLQDAESCQLNPCFQLVKLLSHSPHIANYVRSLTIKVTQPPFHRRGCIQDVEIVSILQDKLQRLERVCLAPADEKSAVRWSDMHENTRAVFLMLLRLPTLKEVSIRDIEIFPLSTFDECQNITRLLLRGHSCHSDTLDWEGQSPYPRLDFLSGNFCHSDTWQVRSPYPRLDFLSLESCPPTLIPWVGSRTLRSLDFRVDDPDMFQELLEVCSDTLTSLNVDLYAYFSTEYDYISGTSIDLFNTSFNFSALSKLQQLSIHTFVRFETNFFLNSTGGDILESRRSSSSLPAIVQALLTLPSSCPLKVVTLHFQISATSDFNLSEMDWSPLFSPSLFSIIHRIDLRIEAISQKGTSVVPPLTTTSSLTVNQRLMKLVEQRLLTVKVEGFGGSVDALSGVGI